MKHRVFTELIEVPARLTYHSLNVGCGGWPLRAIGDEWSHMLELPRDRLPFNSSAVKRACGKI